jgi:FAD/FMN-containing dehydrogenase/Fe-S oxidoreductase
VTGEVRFDRLSRALYSTDASVYQIVPLGVVLPRTEADVIATVNACARFRVPLTARGGGTSQAGQAIGAGVQLDCSKYFSRVLEINPAERWVRVEPGCVLDDLNLQVKPLGLHFAPDVSTSNRATLGGMIANNSSGTHSVVYGKTVDHVLELKVVLADGQVVHLRPLTGEELESKCALADHEGECYRVVRRLAAEHAAEIERRFPKILRRVGGYNLDLFTAAPSADQPFNLAHLLVGSEGTLGVTLEAKLRLVELPRAKVLLVAQFTHLLDALAVTPAILKHRPAAVEVVDRYVLDSTRLNPEAARLRDFLRGDPGAILLIEFFGDTPEELRPRLEALTAELRWDHRVDHLHPAVDPAAQARIWKLRKAALGLSMAQKGDAKALSFVEDTAVDPEHLRDYIAELLAVVARHGTTAGVYAHASVGCLHVRPVIDLKTENGVRQFESIATEVAGLVLKYGGALSGEHGDGLVRSPFQEKMYGPVLYQTFRGLKRTFDPLNLLNPGKIVDAPPLTANLRYGPVYVTPEVPTTFDFSADGGIVRAAELCAGVGACRKKREGTMCPSYQATRDEQHSTRGRANALRLAITGQLGSDGLTDPALHDALDLCLECKACKAECPTNVDMARLKAEFLHQYYRRNGLPWRNRVFAKVATLNAWGWDWLGGGWQMVNYLARSGPGRWLNEKLLGIDRRRRPPVFHGDRHYAELLFAQESELRRGPDPPRAGDVLFFPDTWAQYYEADVLPTACHLLRQMGSVVTLGYPYGWKGNLWPADLLPQQMRCCGRPHISNGLLDQAVHLAEHNTRHLYPWAAHGRPIIACEPSCILTIKDDYPALLRGDLRRQAETVAAVCQTFEEFVGAAMERQPAFSLRAGPKQILVQGHCHQRSLVGMEPTLRLLRRIPGAAVSDLDAGCCGMAGSFGYEKEHYEISRLVGEQRLFPALRQADPDTVVVAPGFSCRMQIQHFTGRTALHPAQLLAGLLDPPA